MSRQPDLSLQLRIEGSLQFPILTEPEYSFDFPSNLGFPGEVARGDWGLWARRRPKRHLPSFDSPEPDDRSEQEDPACVLRKWRS